MHQILSIQLDRSPFSRFGSYHAFSVLESHPSLPCSQEHNLWLRTVHGNTESPVMRVSPFLGDRLLSCDFEVTPGELQIVAPEGRVRICIFKPNEIRVRVEGVSLRLEMAPAKFHFALAEPGGSILMNIASARRLYRAVPVSGTLRLDAPWTVERCTRITVDLLAGPDGVGEFAIEDFVEERPPHVSEIAFEEAVAIVEREFEMFSAPYVDTAENHEETARLAAFTTWSAVVEPCGYLGRPAMFMSKNVMTHVWSWDHMFNALALACGHEDLAWDTFMLMFDHQTELGQLPDAIDDGMRYYNFVKPPIHGWILGLMMQIAPNMFHGDRLVEAYQKLSLHSRWWLERRGGAEGLPRYHHGNDSGWDNATVFDPGFPMEAADLAAFLILQLELVADLASRLALNDEAIRWLNHAEQLKERMMQGLWNGSKFICRRSQDGKVNEMSDSIFGCLPVVLGNRLPREIRAKLVSEIRRNLTEWGLATENPMSPLYRADGYWRGPIWAPPTLVMVDGLTRMGEEELAVDIASRFCRLCARSGFAENFNAQTGEPLCDQAYTWTASVYLVLLHRYVGKAKMGQS